MLFFTSYIILLDFINRENKTRILLHFDKFSFLDIPFPLLFHHINNEKGVKDRKFESFTLKNISLLKNVFKLFRFSY